MLRFGTNTNKRRSVRNYSSRREQLRLLALFIPLAVVVLLMTRLRDPKTANAINQFFASAEQQNQSEIEPRLAPPAGWSVADSVPPRSPVLFPGIRADLLKTIEDNTYFRPAEKDAWFHFFELMQKPGAIEIQGGPVEYAQLVDQPNVYRGTLVTVRGTARKITQEKPADNNVGISSYYSVVIQPVDGANWPVIVYCLQLPKVVSPGDDLSVDVVVTGLFFKKLSYKWRDGLAIAPVIVADSLTTNSNPENTTAHEPAANEPRDTFQQTQDKVNAEESSARPQQAASSQQAFQQIMSLAGWGADRLRKFDEGDALSEEQRVDALELLHRLRSIRTSDLDAWHSNVGLTKELKNPDAIRGQLCRLNGVVMKVTHRKPSLADAERLEMPLYFECEFKALELADPVTIITGRVPADWLRASGEHHAAAANAMFVKRLTTDPSSSRTLWLAKEIAWYPSVPGLAPNGSIGQLVGNCSDPRLGKSLLGALNVDVGQFDLVQGRGRIRAQERDLFYETMRAVGHMAPSALIQFAKGNLPFVKRQWEQQLHDDKDSKRESLAREIVRRAGEGKYSVALLFNDPLPQRGRLFLFDGTARRAVRVEVGGHPSGERENGVAIPQDLDHYYELEVFTEDSQNYPLIFCVPELPKGFPVGSDIRVPVRVAGFFFKNWLYRTRGRGQSDELADTNSAGPQAQFAPLLIGRAPVVLETIQPASHAGRFLLGGLFVLALAGIWAAAAWFARDDRRFRERTPAAKFELPPGQSLNDLNVPAANVPMTTKESSD